MATITKRQYPGKNKGYYFYIQVKYKDSVTGNWKTKGKSYKPLPGMSVKDAKMEAIKIGLELDEEAKHLALGEIEYFQKKYEAITFEKYSLEWIEKNKNNFSPSVYSKRKEALVVINRDIGKYELNSITPFMLQNYYDEIDTRKRKMIEVKGKPKLREKVYSKGFTYTLLEKTYKVRMETFTKACNGHNVALKWAEWLSEVTGIPFDELFTKREYEVDYADDTKHDYKKIIRLVLSSAKKQGVIKENYATAEYITFPKRKKTKVQAMDDKEIKTFFDTVIKCDDIRIKTAMLIFLFTGFRRAEVAGLSWDNINFERKTISIEKTVNYIKELGVYEKEPKTSNSKRTITVSSIVLDTLKEYKKWQDIAKENWDKKNANCNKVFTRQNGDLFSPEIFLNWLRKIEDTAGLKHYTLHSLRHSNIMLQLMAGVPAGTVSQRAGHYRESVTTDIYSFAIERTDQMAADTLDKLFGINNSISGNIVKPVLTSLEGTNDISIIEYRENALKAKKLGFESYDEYLDYLEFVESKNRRKLNE